MIAQNTWFICVLQAILGIFFIRKVYAVCYFAGFFVSYIAGFLMLFLNF